MTDLEFHWSEYIKVGSESPHLVQETLYPLLPQRREKVEAKVAAAERALKMADVSLAKG
jgi:hypothetical protein